MLSILLWLQIAAAGSPSGQSASPQLQEVDATMVEVTVTVVEMEFPGTEPETQ
jgi:hypothetical protein